MPSVFTLEGPRLDMPPSEPAYVEPPPGTVISLTPPAWSRLTGSLANPGVEEFLKERHPVCRVVLVVGAALGLGAAVGAATVWSIRRAGGQ
jgi:hypothetical protein